jgi:hypothetical protein
VAVSFRLPLFLLCLAFVVSLSLFWCFSSARKALRPNRRCILRLAADLFFRDRFQPIAHQLND